MLLLRWLRRGLILLGCALFLLAFAAFLFERTGGVERLARKELRAALEHEPDLRANFQSLDVEWLRARAVLSGLVVEGAGGALELERTTFVLDLGRREQPLAAVDVRGGRFVFTEAFVQGLARVATGPPGEDTGEPEEPTEEAALPLPLVNVTELDVALGTSSGAPVELGRASLHVQREGATLAARGTVALMTDDGMTAPLHVRASLSEYGDDGGDGAVTLEAAARDLVVQSRGSQLRPLLPPAWQTLDVKARASLDLAGRLPLDGSLPTELGIDFTLSEGYLRPSAELPALEALELVGALDLAPSDPNGGATWLQRARGAASFGANVAGEDVRGALDLAPGGVLAARAFGPALTLSDRRLAEFGFTPEHPVRHEWAALALDGRGDVRLGVRLGLADPLESLDVSAAVDLDGESRAQFNGFTFPNHPREGVPLPVDQIGGHVALVHQTRSPQPTLVGLHGIRGSHGTGPVDVVGMIASPSAPAPPGQVEEPDLDLFISVHDRALDEPLRVALGGMSGTDWIWDAFQPGGGVAQGEVVLRSRPALGGLTAVVSLNLSDTSARWEEFPIDVTVQALDLDLVWAPRSGRDIYGWPYRAMGGRFSARGQSASVENLTVEGMLRGASFDGPEEVTGLPPLSFVRVVAPGLALRGRDFDELAVILPTLTELGAELGTKGRVDVEYVDVQPGGAAELESWLELTPRTVELLPKEFPMPTRDVRGRVTMAARAVRGGDGERTQTGRWLASLVGNWAGGMRVAATFEQALADGAAGELAFAAGALDPANRALLGALSRGQGSDVGQASTEGLALDGRVDLTGWLAIDEGAPPPRFDVHLRGNRFEKDKLVVDDLGGTLRIEGGEVSGERLHGRLAATELVLEDVRFAFDATAREGDEYFRATINAQDVPLDAEHLGPFLEPEVLEALFEEFEWEGRVDLDGVRLSLSRAADGRETTRLAGPLHAERARLVMGAPVEVQRAEIDLRDFVLEGGRARAWGTVEGLAAEAAGRAIEAGSFLFSYVDQRLTVQGLDTRFAGGTLRALGGRSATALAIDLASPYHMAVSIEAEGIDAGPMLADAFGGTKQNGARNEGKIDGSLRFEAIPGEILAATGAGWVRVREARLWSIPVFRELFTQLGFDATAVFDSMQTSFTIQNGKLELTEMRAHSPLLVLVGKGLLDMNGDMRFDLEVRYSLIDKLGPLRYIVYWFQNTLLRVEVRGDLYRPVVILRNAFFDIFKRKYRNEPRLPLPYPDSLPQRF